MLRIDQSEFYKAEQLLDKGFPTSWETRDEIQLFVYSLDAGRFQDCGLLEERETLELGLDTGIDGFRRGVLNLINQ